MTKSKREFWVVYDYGQGGLWAVVTARSAEEIVAKYPILKVENDRPSWANDKERERVLSSNAFDIDGTPPEWLARAMKERK